MRIYKKEYVKGGVIFNHNFHFNNYISYLIKANFENLILKNMRTILKKCVVVSLLVSGYTLKSGAECDFKENYE